MLSETETPAKTAKTANTMKALRNQHRKMRKEGLLTLSFKQWAKEQTDPGTKTLVNGWLQNKRERAQCSRTGKTLPKASAPVKQPGGKKK